MLYKIINEIAIVLDKEILILAETITRCKHEHKLCIMTDNTNQYKYSFFPQTISQWNCLPKASADVVPHSKVTPPTRVDKDLPPISLTPVLCKGLELQIKHWTLDLTKHLLDPHQYGLLPGYSTTQALVELLYS